MKRKNFELLGDIMNRVMRQEGLETPLNEYRAVNRFPEVLGPNVSRYITRIELRNGTLYVNLSNPALRQELMMSRTNLAQRINALVGADVVQNVVFC